MGFGITPIQGPDITPDSFAFSPQLGIDLSVLAVSESVQPVNYNSPAPVSVTNGEYSIDGAAFTSADGTISPGSSIRARHTSSASTDTETVTTLVIGGASAQFLSRTNPAVLSFSAQSGFSLAGTIALGESLTLTDSSSRLGTKRTQAPHYYDLCDLGVWVDGVKLPSTIYDQLGQGDEVPASFSGGRIDPDSPWRDNVGAVYLDATGPSVGHTYSFRTGNGANDGHLNVRGDYASPQPSVFEPDDGSGGKQHYASWMWYSDFSPGSSGKGTSSKFLRLWDTAGSTSDVVQISWTRMHWTNGRSTPQPNWGQTNHPTDEWVNYEHEMDYRPVGEGGYARGLVGGVHPHSELSSINDAGFDDNLHVRTWGWDPSSGTNISGSEVIRFSDLYVDRSVARAVITNNPSYAASTMRVPQLHTSWAPDRIELAYPYYGPLGRFSGNHLHVVREDLTTLYVGEFL